MDIVEFFKLSAGRWSAIKSSHDWNSGQQVTHKAVLQFDWLDSTAPEISQLCIQHKIESSLALCGLRLTWEDVTNLGQKKIGNALWVPIASLAPHQGTFLQLAGSTLLQGHYALSHDKLSLVADAGDLHTEEQVWFESENVRLRSSIVKTAQGAGSAAFYSEVRLLGAPKE